MITLHFHVSYLQLNLCKLCKGNCQFVYLTDWNEHYLNKLWPGWDATLKDNNGKWKVDPPVTSIGKFEPL